MKRHGLRAARPDEHPALRVSLGHGVPELVIEHSQIDSISAVEHAPDAEGLSTYGLTVRYRR